MANVGSPDVIMKDVNVIPSCRDSTRRPPQKIFRRGRQDVPRDSSSDSVGARSVHGDRPGVEADDAVDSEYKAKIASLEDMKLELWRVDDVSAEDHYLKLSMLTFIPRSLTKKISSANSLRMIRKGYPHLRSSRS